MLSMMDRSRQVERGQQLLAAIEARKLDIERAQWIGDDWDVMASQVELMRAVMVYEQHEAILDIGLCG